MAATDVMDASLIMQFGDLVIDLERYRVLLAAQPVVLTYREYALLVYLATHPDHVVTKRRLLEEGMGRHDAGGLRMLDEHIRHLRSKLERDGRRRWIEEAGEGYRFLAGDVT